MSDLIKAPRYTIIEQVAVNCAAVWYEIGRGQGLKSKWPNARAYAKNNLEKFIPKAVKVCLQMLEPTSKLPEQAKMDIYEALMERHNDPTLGKLMPNFDVEKAIAIADDIKRKTTKPIDVVLDKAFDVKELLKPDFKNTTSLYKDITHGQKK